MLVPILIGSGLVILAVVLVVARWYQRAKMGDMKITQTESAGSLQDIARAVAADIGGGSFRQYTEVKGVAEADSPLTSELAKIACVYYHMSITREYEETYWDTDQNGKRVQRTRRGSETVASNTRSIPFRVRDQTGHIEVDVEGADLHTETVHSRFEPGSGLDGSFRIILGAGQRTLGYRYHEDAIPLGNRLYVLGEASDEGGALAIRDNKEGRSFIVSTKSEEELMKRAGSMSMWFLIGAIASALIGIGLIVYGAVAEPPPAS